MQPTEPRLQLTRPRPLTRTGHVAVLAISSPSAPDRIELAADRLRSEGLTVTLAPNLYSRERNYLSGTDSDRLRILNEFLRRPEFDGFLFARGGYGAMRILDAIDYDAVRTDPRVMIGYSDLTALHQAVAVRSGVASFHGPMLNLDFHDGLSPERADWFWGLLAGGRGQILRFEERQVLAPGRAEGTLFGGCLSLTAALMGTPYDFWIPGGIWFWEDISEPAYRLDRMLTHLRLSGKLQTLSGVMIGKLKDCGGSDPAELDQMLRGFFSDAGIPVVRDLPFGHHGDNLLLPIGASVELDTVKCTFIISEPVVAHAAGRSDR